VREQVKAFRRMVIPAMALLTHLDEAVTGQMPTINKKRPGQLPAIMSKQTH